jgi:hypothetical protein
MTYEFCIKLLDVVSRVTDTTDMEKNQTQIETCIWEAWERVAPDLMAAFAESEWAACVVNGSFDHLIEESMSVDVRETWDGMTYDERRAVAERCI